jgi:hypothetical protein
MAGRRGCASTRDTGREKHHATAHILIAHVARWEVDHDGNSAGWGEHVNDEE